MRRYEDNHGFALISALIALAILMAVSCLATACHKDVVGAMSEPVREGEAPISVRVS